MDSCAKRLGVLGQVPASRGPLELEAVCSDVTSDLFLSKCYYRKKHEGCGSMGSGEAFRR